MVQEYKILDLKLYLFVKVFRWFLFALFAVGCELSVEGRGLVALILPKTITLWEVTC